MAKIKQLWPALVGLVLLVVLGVFGGMVSAQRSEAAKKEIVQYCNDVNSRLSDVQTRLPPPRSKLVAHYKDGNAVPHYLYVEWVLVNTPIQAPSPLQIDSALTQNMPTEKKHNLKALTDLFLASFKGQKVKLSEYEYSLYQIYKPLIEQLRVGVAKSDCIWRKWPQTLDSHDAPGRRQCWKFITVVWLYEILTNDSLDAIAELKKLIAVTYDLARRPGLGAYYDPLIMSALISAAALQIARQGSERYNFEKLKNVLNDLLIPSFHQPIKDEQFMMDIALASLDPQKTQQANFAPFEITELNYIKTIDAVSLNTNLKAWNNYKEITRNWLKNESNAPSEDVLSEFQADYLFAKLAIAHRITKFRQLTNGVHARRNATQIAIMFWQEKHRRGKFPESIDAVERYFEGKLPKDPFDVTHDFQWNKSEKKLYSLSEDKFKLKIDAR